MSGNKISLENVKLLLSRFLSLTIYPLMIIVLFIVSCNYVNVNNSIQYIWNDSLNTIHQIDSLCRQNDILQSDSLRHARNLTFQLDKYKDYLIQMNELKKGIFDSNTITFMASFILVFLGGILFNIEDRAKKQVKKSEYMLNKIEIERQMMNLNTQMQCLLLITKYAQSIFIMQKHTINGSVDFIINEIFTMSQVLLGQLKKKDYLYLTASAKKNCEDILKRILEILENERDYDNPKNIHKKGAFDKLILILTETLEYIKEFKVIDGK